MSVDELRMQVAVSCRILGMLGLVRESTGHVSARIPGTDEMWIRCRGGAEEGIMFTGIHNIRRTDFDGKGDHVDAAHASPAETAIHGEIYRAHPEVMSVVHAHPYYALMCGVTRLDFRPVFGAYEPSALDMILKGVPVYPVARTVSNKQDAAHMLECMADRDVLLMQGHGITATGKGVAQSTTLAIRFDRTANIMWDLALSGLEAPEISQEDMDRYNRPARPLGGADEGRRAGWSGIDGAELWGWNHYVKMLETSNIGLPDDLDAE